MSELAALRRHAIQIRSAMQPRSERLNVAIAEIVTEYDDEIGRIRGRIAIARRDRVAENEGREQRDRLYGFGMHD